MPPALIGHARWCVAGSAVLQCSPVVTGGSRPWVSPRFLFRPQRNSGELELRPCGVAGKAPKHMGCTRPQPGQDTASSTALLMRLMVDSRPGVMASQKASLTALYFVLVMLHGCVERQLQRPDGAKLNRKANVPLAAATQSSVARGTACSGCTACTPRGGMRGSIPRG